MRSNAVGHRGALTALTAVVLALLVGGCAGGGETSSIHGATTLGATRSTSPPSAPVPGRDMPRPSALGRGWQFRVDGTIGLVVRLRFASAGDATTFMLRRGAALAACAAQASSVGPISTGLVQQLRTEAGDLHDDSAWTEIAEVGSPGTDVTLVAVHALESAPVARRAVAGLGSSR